MPRVLVSAGHTMMDPGAIFGDLREADLTRKIAGKVVEKLAGSNLQVTAVPLDMPINDRIQWINSSNHTAANGDILVEIHINDADTTKRGMEIWFEGNGDNESQKLGVAIADSVITKHSFTNQGVRSEFDHDLGSLRFLNQTQPHAVIVEVLYIDNAEDISLLKNDQELDSIAESIATGVAKYCGKTLNGTDLAEADKPNYPSLISTYVKKSERSNAFANLSAGNTPVPPVLPSTPSLPPTATPAFPPPAPAFGNNPNPAFGGTPGFAGGNSFAGGTFGGPSQFMDREKRKEMIEKTYERILGSKPNQNDLNTYLNRGISEEELTKKLIESEEHADLIKAKDELETIRKEQATAEQKVLRLQAGVKDMQEMINQLNKLLVHKNAAINQLEHTFTQHKGLPTQVYQQIQAAKAMPKSTPNAQTSVKLSPSFTEKIFRKFAKRFS